MAGIVEGNQKILPNQECDVTSWTYTQRGEHIPVHEGQVLPIAGGAVLRFLACLLSPSWEQGCFYPSSATNQFGATAKSSYSEYLLIAYIPVYMQERLKVSAVPKPDLKEVITL